VPWRYDVVESEHAVRDGYIAIPLRPGLGIDVNEREAARYPWQPELVQRYFHPDGSVADW